MGDPARGDLVSARMADDEIVISAGSPLRKGRGFLADAARDLRAAPPTAWLVFRRSLRARRRSGFVTDLWLVLPVLTVVAVSHYVHRSGLVGLHRTPVSYSAFVASGMALWLVFSDGIQTPLRRLTTVRAALTKAPVPHEAWLGAAAFDVAYGFMVRAAVAVVFLLAAGVSPRWSWALVPLAAVALGILGFVVGVLVAPAGLVYPDLGNGLAALAGIWFFLTPVVYAWPAPGGGPGVVRANPATPLLVTGRAWLTGTGGAELARFAVVGAAAAVALAAVWLLYRIVRPHAVALL